MDVRDFTIAVPDEDVAELHCRLAATRWPRRWPEPAWSAGTDQDTLRHLVDYWCHTFDWRRHEERLNAEPHKIASIEGQHIHFLHTEAAAPTGLPVLATNGWPSTVRLLGKQCTSGLSIR
jgi:hypothetical protein